MNFPLKDAYMIAVSLARNGMRKSHLQFVQGLEEQPLALVLQVVEGSFGGDQVRVPDDRTNEETVVADFTVTRHLKKVLVC